MNTIPTPNSSEDRLDASSEPWNGVASSRSRCLEGVEETLHEWLTGMEPSVFARPSRGAEPVIPGLVLWAGILVCILRGVYSQLELWRLLTRWGLWHFPRYQVTDMAIYHRLERMKPEQMETFYAAITECIRQHFSTLSPDCPPTARTHLANEVFANGVFALDQTTLDPLLRKLKVLRDLPKGAPELLPGKLCCLFDITRQQWERIRFIEEAHQNEKLSAWSMVETLQPGALVLADLGYFSFAWFDQLTEHGYYYVSRLREKTSFIVQHTFYQGGTPTLYLVDQLINLGAYRADRASHPVRLVTITHKTGTGSHTYRYLTNVLDPRLLPASQILELYRRRWDIEQAFNLIKTHLKLHLLFSGKRNALLVQIYGTFIIAQIVLALRSEIAKQARVDLRDVSMELLVRYIPRYLSEGRDPIGEFVRDGPFLGFIRPFRGKEYALPQANLADYCFPDAPPKKRTPRYAGRKCGLSNDRENRREPA